MTSNSVALAARTSTTASSSSASTTVPMSTSTAVTSSSSTASVSSSANVIRPTNKTSAASMHAARSTTSSVVNDSDSAAGEATAEEDDDPMATSTISSIGGGPGGFATARPVPPAFTSHPQMGMGTQSRSIKRTKRTYDTMGLGHVSYPSAPSSVATVIRRPTVRRRQMRRDMRHPEDLSYEEELSLLTTPVIVPIHTAPTTTSSSSTSVNVNDDYGLGTPTAASANGAMTPNNNSNSSGNANMPAPGAVWTTLSNVLRLRSVAGLDVTSVAYWQAISNTSGGMTNSTTSSAASINKLAVSSAGSVVAAIIGIGRPRATHLTELEFELVQPPGSSASAPKPVVPGIWKILRFTTANELLNARLIALRVRFILQWIENCKHANNEQQLTVLEPSSLTGDSATRNEEWGIASRTGPTKDIRFMKTSPNDGKIRLMVTCGPWTLSELIDLRESFVRTMNQMMQVQALVMESSASASDAPSLLCLGRLVLS